MPPAGHGAPEAPAPSEAGRDATNDARNDASMTPRVHSGRADQDPASAHPHPVCMPAPAHAVPPHPAPLAGAPSVCPSPDTASGARGRQPGRFRRAAAGLTIASLPLLAGAILMASPPGLPMAFARGLHAARLRLAGARVERYATPLLQQGLNDCGVAVARELGRRQARPVSEAALEAALPLTPLGIALDPLAAGLGALGLPGTVLRHAWQLPLQPLDVLLLRSHHFVLLLDASPDHVRYYDPMVGTVRRTRDAFRQDWTGKLIRQRPLRRRSPPFPQDQLMQTSNSRPTRRTARTALGALSAALLLAASVSAAAPLSGDAWHGTATTTTTTTVSDAETGGGPGFKCLGCVSAGIVAVWAVGPASIITTLIVGGAPAVAIGGYVAGCAVACVSYFNK